MKVVINICYGGFGLSEVATDRYLELKNLKYTRQQGIWDITHYLLEDGEYFHGDDLERDDPTLIQVVEELGNDAAGKHAKLKIVDIPDDVAWEIDSYDGNESVRELSRAWR